MSLSDFDKAFRDAIADDLDVVDGLETVELSWRGKTRVVERANRDARKLDAPIQAAGLSLSEVTVFMVKDSDLVGFEFEIGGRIKTGESEPSEETVEYVVISKTRDNLLKVSDFGAVALKTVLPDRAELTRWVDDRRVKRTAIGSQFETRVVPIALSQGAENPEATGLGGQWVAWVDAEVARSVADGLGGGGVRLKGGDGREYDVTSILGLDGLGSFASFNLRSV